MDAGEKLNTGHGTCLDPLGDPLRADDEIAVALPGTATVFLGE